MNELINAIRNDKTLFRGYGAALFFSAISLVLIALFYMKLPPFIPLYNQMPWGEARLAGKLEILLPPAITLSILTINTVVSSVLYKKLPLISRLMCIATVLTSLLLLFIIIRTVLLVVI